MHRSLAVVCVAVAALSSAAAAHASTVGVVTPGDLGSHIQFVSGPKPSDVQVSFSGGILVSDALQTLKAGPGCIAGNPVSCPQIPIDALLGKGDDRFRGFSLSDITVAGGAGDDDVQASGNNTSVRGG